MIYFTFTHTMIVVSSHSDEKEKAAKEGIQE